MDVGLVNAMIRVVNRRHETEAAIIAKLDGLLEAMRHTDNDKKLEKLGAAVNDMCYVLYSTVVSHDNMYKLVTDELDLERIKTKTEWEGHDSGKQHVQS